MVFKDADTAASPRLLEQLRVWFGQFVSSHMMEPAWFACSVDSFIPILDITGSDHYLRHMLVT
jgi:hypothetical protein